MMDLPLLPDAFKYLFGAVPLVLGAGYLYLSHIRSKHSSLPPASKNKSFLWGDLKLINDHIQKVGADKHVDLAFYSVFEANGYPPYLYLDFQPAQPGMFIILDGPFTEKIHKAAAGYPLGLPKSSTFTAFSPIFGETSILLEYDHWKPLRKRYNPGFQTQHLYKLMPEIIKETLKATQILEVFASRGENVRLVDVLTRMSFDIIGVVALEEDLGAQKLHLIPGNVERRGIGLEVYNSFEELRAEFATRVIFKGGPYARFKQYMMKRKLDNQIRDIIEKKIESSSTSDRSVIGLTLNEDPMPPMQEMIDQVKTFLFAGHDTVAATIAWTLYEITKEESVTAKLIAELESIIPPSAASRADSAKRQAEISDAILKRPELLNELSYLEAIIKESLRLWAPASTVRHVPKDKPFPFHFDGRDWDLAGVMIYPITHGIHNNPRGWGPDVKQFRPERWLGVEYAEKTSKIVADGWYRPFEKQPRNCIGQMLAMIEMKIVLPLLVTRFKFEHVGEAPFMAYHIIAKPNDGMTMKLTTL